MHQIYFCLSIFYTLEDSAWCCSIQVLTIGDFNSFGFFWDTLYIHVHFKKLFLQLDMDILHHLEIDVCSMMIDDVF